MLQAWHPSVSLSVCLTVCLSVHLSVWNIGGLWSRSVIRSGNGHVVGYIVVLATCMRKPTLIVVSCDSKFYWGYGKMWSFALTASNGSHVVLSQHLLSLFPLQPHSSMWFGYREVPVLLPKHVAFYFHWFCGSVLCLICLIQV